MLQNRRETSKILTVQCATVWYILLYTPLGQLQHDGVSVAWVGWFTKVIKKLLG